MAKTRRLITENLKNVDAVIEPLDARIPYSSRNPEIKRLCADKPSILLLNKAGLADPNVTHFWKQQYSDDHTICLETDCITGAGLSQIAPSLRKLCEEKLARYEQKGMVGRSLKVMVVGIPNVGKSSLINKLCGNKKTKVENRPGVTLDKQWVATNIGILLLDMPGVLWPKFEEKEVGENLAVTGAIKDDVLDVESIAMILVSRLRDQYPNLLTERYKLLEIPSREEMDDYDLMCLIGRKRGFLISGGEVNTERTANMLLEEFRGAKIGRISLDTVKN
jgi:ribosome biogenesis GTPase A